MRDCIRQTEVLRTIRRVVGVRFLEIGGWSARIRKHCPEIMVWSDTFSGQSGHFVLIDRVRDSSDDQSLELARNALLSEGCERILEDTVGGAGEDPALRKALEHLRAGDTSSCSTSSLGSG